MARASKSQQINFYCMPEETKEIVEFIHQSGYLIFEPAFNSEKPEPWDCGPPLRGQVYVCPADLVSAIALYRIGENRYAIDCSISPVIELSSPIVSDGEVIRGRIYTLFGYMGREEWVVFPASLIAAHHAICRHIQRSILTKEKYLGGYISKGTTRFQQLGGKLRQF